MSGLVALVTKHLKSSGCGDGSYTAGGIYLQGQSHVSRKREAQQPQAAVLNHQAVGIFSICGGLWGGGYVGLGLNVLDI